MNNTSNFKQETLSILNDISASIKGLTTSLENVMNNLNNIEEQAAYETNPRQKYIDECILSFDWDRVKKVMDYLNWEWYILKDGTCRVPDITDMTTQAREMLEKCYGAMDNKCEERYTISQGGFEVVTYEDNNCELRFVCASYESY